MLSWLRSLPPTHLVEWLSVLSRHHAPMGHSCRPGQAWDVCKQQGGEAASRALTQVQVVQAKREEQGRHCHLERGVRGRPPPGRGVGSGAPHTLPLLWGLLFRLVFGMLYPTYASYKAVKTKNIREYVSAGVGRRAQLRWGDHSLGGVVGFGEVGESELASLSSRGTIWWRTLEQSGCGWRMGSWDSLQDLVGAACWGGYRNEWRLLRGNFLRPARCQGNAVGRAFWNLGAGSARDRGFGTAGAAAGL